jgi:predicted dehydrogenase
LWEINGTEGDLQISAIGGQPQIFDLSVRGATASDKAMQPLEVPPQYCFVADLTGPALNVAQTYSRRLDDIERGTQSCPAFEDAVVRHRLLAAVEASAITGSRIVF